MGHDRGEAAVSSPLVDLFAELDRIEFDPERLSDPDYVLLQLARRQEIFDKVQSLDAAHLDLATRAKLLERIQAIQQRDRALARALESHRNDLAEKLNALVQGRSVTRGYRPSDAETDPKGGKRIA
jgi:hypothetical protein